VSALRSKVLALELEDLDLPPLFEERTLRTNSELESKRAGVEE